MSPSALEQSAPHSADAPLTRRLAASDTGRSAGLAAAVIAMNVLALVFTVVFARILGAAGYGSLAALISAFIILMVPGSALQIATARHVSHAVADGDAAAGHEVRLWIRHLAVATVAVALIAVPLRAPLAALIAVDQSWAAAAVPVSGMLWAIVCVERGALQALARYKLVGASLVGEATFRLLLGLALVAIGLDVTGAFLASAAALVVVGLVLLRRLRADLPDTPAGHETSLRELLAGSGAPVAALTLLFLLQEGHVIVVKHAASDDAAGSYAVAAVAAKGVIWVAVGLGMYLLPEATKRARHDVDARPVLASTLGLIAATGVPMVLVYAVAGEPLLAAVFGDDLTAAAGALPWLGAAMTFLAWSYLSVQYLLALRRARFIALLAVATLADVAILASVGSNLTNVAVALFALQAVTGALMVAIAARTRHPSDRTGPYLPV